MLPHRGRSTFRALAWTFRFALRDVACFLSRLVVDTQIRAAPIRSLFGRFLVENSRIKTATQL